MGQQFYVLKKMPPIGGAQQDKDKVPADAKALAPKPGVKPQNPKKGARPGTPGASAPVTTATTATATDDVEPATGEPAADVVRPAPGGGATRATAANRHPAKARPKKRKGGRR
jgi:YidC/Oxa1 family membrane protein insertase